MTDLYDALCVVRTSIVNSIGEMLMTGRVVNYATILSAIVDELSGDFNFVEELCDMSTDELNDLGFRYLSEDSHTMLIPLWLYPFIPEGEQLYGLDDKAFIVGEDDFEIYADSWVNAGIIIV